MSGKADWAWQWKLLPLMCAVLVCAALFFAWESVSEFSDFKARITSPSTDLSPIFQQLESSGATITPSNRLEYAQWKTLVLLEQETVKHRYAQGNATILARLWTRLMGFTTGMVLAIIGSAFILGKLQEAQSELKQETELLKFSLATSSPGIVLAVLGTALMSITLLTRFDIEIHDVPVYLNTRMQLNQSPPDPSKLLAPKNLGDSEKAMGAGKSKDPAQGGSP